MARLAEHLKSTRPSSSNVSRQGITDATDSDDEETNDIPENLRQIIEQHIDDFPEPDRQLLEAASVAGPTFSAALVATALESDIESVEQHCERLARSKQFLQRLGVSEWPDGTFAGEYGFIHFLDRQTLYERILPRKRARVHQVMGECLERAHGEHSSEIANQLALHFRESRDHVRAVRYLGLLAQNAIERHAYQEATHLLDEALSLSKRLPETADRNHQELRLQVSLAAALRCHLGIADPKVERTYHRAYELRESSDDPALSASAFWGLASYSFLRQQMRSALSIGQEFLAWCDKTGSRDVHVAAQAAMACTLFHLGEHARSGEHAALGVEAYHARPKAELASLCAQDHGVLCCTYLGLTQAMRGENAQAQASMHRALSFAKAGNHRYTFGVCLYNRAKFHQLRHEAKQSKKAAREAMAFAHEQGFPLPEAAATIVYGWAMAMEGEHEEGIAHLRRGMQAFHRGGADIGRPWHLGLLAEAHLRSGQAVQGLETVEEALALAQNSEDRMAEPELHRLQGELRLLQSGPSADEAALACFQQALKVAYIHEAKNWELRAATALAQLWMKQRKQQRVCVELLAPLCGRVNENDDLPDHKRARQLIGELGVSTSG